MSCQRVGLLIAVRSRAVVSLGRNAVHPGRQHIEDCVRSSLDSYFRDLRGTEPDGMYDMLVRVVEKPLLDVVMTRAEGNQSRAAQWLGMNRNTLRKKLVEHKLLK